ncbi:MAG: hypothetical protein HC778_04600 [Chamaesiphon sp. CSU_1_12]|nr:hypothetical protein [Chamaesiphon sp. CSU_1_12]
MPPSGSGSHQVKFKGNLIGTVYQYGTEFHTTHSEIYGCSDPYNATLTLITTTDLEAGKLIVEKRHITSATSMMSGF